MRDEYGVKRSRGIGKLFLGIFLGFLLTLGLIAGGLALVYFKFSLNTFHVDIGNDTIESYTPNQLVKVITSIMKDKNTISLEDLGKDFGLKVPTEVVGIDISDLTSVPIMQIADAAEEKFKTITADELRGVLNLGDKLNNILDGTKRYYVSGNTLYVDEGHTQPVTDFKYNIADDKVTIKNHPEDITDGHVDFATWYVPLVNAFGDIEHFSVAQLLGYTVDGDRVYKGQEEITGILRTLAKMAVGEIAHKIQDFTVADVLGYEIKPDGKVYDGGKEVTGITKTISQVRVMDLSNKINTFTVADVLGYEVREGIVYDEKGEPVDGLIASIGGTLITELPEEISTLTVAKVVGYTKVGDVWKDKNGNEVNGFMAYVAEKKINELSNIVNEVKVKDILGYKEVDGVLKDKDGNTITGILKLVAEKNLNELSTSIDTLTIGQILDYTIGENGKVTDSAGNEVTGFMKLIADKNIKQLKDSIDDFKIKDILGYTEQDGKLMDGNKEVTGIMKLIADKKIKELGGVIDEFTIGQILGHKDQGGKLVNDKGEEVKGILKALSGKKISEISGTISDLKVGDLFDETDRNKEDNKILTLIPENTSLTDIPKALKEAIQTKTMNDLVVAGVISIDNWQQVKEYKTGKDGKTLGETQFKDAINVLVDLLKTAQTLYGK